MHPDNIVQEVMQASTGITIPYCQQTAEEKERTGKLYLRKEPEKHIYMAFHLWQKTVIWEFTLAILSLAHSLPKMHSRL